MSQSLTRQELYHLLWACPIGDLMKKYKVTEYGLRKICISLEIPMPLAGHWEKIRLGKAVFQPPLPNYVGKQSTVVLEFRSPMLLKDLVEPESKKANEVPKERLDVNNNPQRLTRPDPIVVAVQNDLKGRNTYSAHELINTSRGFFNVRVSKALIPRTLTLLDAFIKNLKSRGHSIIINDDKSEAIVKDQKIEVSIREKTKVSPEKNQWGSSINMPTGQLILKTYLFGTKEWIDGNTKLEEQLESIITKLETNADEQILRQLEWKRQREEQQKKDQIRKDFEKRREADLKVFIDTLQRSSRWHKVINLRNYLDEFERRAKESGRLTPEVEEWLERARQQANWYDPFLNTQDNLLDEINKETLALPKSQFYSW